MAELTTFGAMSNTMEQAENNPTTPVNEPVVTPEPAAAEPTTPITESSNAVVPEPAAAPVEENVSSSDFSLGEDAAVPEPATPAQPATQPTYNWKEEIKKVDKKELLKELGVDDFAIEINDHLTKGGKAIDYLNARSIDYNKISDDSLIKDDLRKQYPNLNPTQIELMFERKYSPISELQEDKDYAELQLQADAYNVRQKKIAEQQNFKVPDAPVLQTDEAYEQWKQDRGQQAQRVEQITNLYVNHPATKALNESKRVTISLGDGVAPFNFNVDKPEVITNFWTDDGSIFRKLTTTPQGEPDMVKQQKISLFSHNPDKFTQEIFNYGLRCGQQKLVEEGQNAVKPQAKVTSMTNNAAQTVTVGKYGSGNRS